MHMTPAAKANSTTSNRFVFALFGIHPQESIDITIDSKDLSKQYVASSPRRDFLSMNVAMPANGTPLIKVFGVIVLNNLPVA